MLKQIKKLKSRELLSLIVGLCEQNQENEAYVQSFLQRGMGNQQLDKYKKIIAKAISYDPMYIFEDSDNDYDFCKCEQALKSYLSASRNNLEGYVELLVYTIEQASEIEFEYGDMGEAYDEEIEEWYEEAAELIVSIHGTGSDVIDFMERLSVVYLALDAHDALKNIYKKHLLCLTKEE